MRGFAKAAAYAAWMALAGCSLTGEYSDVKTVALAKDGQALAVIVIAKDADKAARFAAADLKWHLDQMTGASYEIIEYSNDGIIELKGKGMLPIFVGPSEGTKTQKKDYEFQEWGVDIGADRIELVGFDREDKGKMTFAITEKDGVTGTNWPWMYDEQGTMYAVYDFLEKECGAVWANPSDFGTELRKDANLAVPCGMRRGKPWMNYRGGSPLDREVVTPLDWKRGSDGEKRYNAFAYAHPKTKGLQDKLYMLRNRLGGDHAEANHSFYWWYDRFWNTKAKTFEAFKPGYFAKGYEGQPPQLCYLNSEVIRQTVEDIRRYFDDDAFRRKFFRNQGRDHYIWGENGYCLEPMDNSSFCQCPKCTKHYEPVRKDDNSMHSTYWFTFVNAVAREIKKSHPTKRISTLAYMSHEGLPTGVTLEDNVTVYFCISGNRMPNSDGYPKQLARMEEWRKAYPAQPLAIWLYNCFPQEVARNGNWHCFPGFFAHEAEKQYRFFHRLNVRGGIFHCGFVDNVDNYLQCKWMVDPTRKADDLLDEYFSIFGRAAKPLRAYYDLVERRFCDKSLYPAGSSHQSAKIAWGTLGDAPTMEALAGYMAEAERLAETDLEKARVKEWRLSIWEYMNEGRESYLRRSTAPKPNWTAVRVAAADGDVAKVSWDSVPQFDAPLYFRGTDKVRDIREQVRVCHDGSYFYLEITEWVQTENLEVAPAIVPCDVWEFVVERQEAQPFRHYMTGCDGRMAAKSNGEVNWRQGVSSEESGLVNYGAKCAVDRTAGDHWTARWAFPLATMTDAPLAPGDMFYLNCVRVASNAVGGPSDHWKFGIYSLTSYTTCKTCDRAGRVTLEK